jgi:DNA ligase-1
VSDPCASVVWALETHNSRLNKEAIIEVQMNAKNDEFFEGCKLALDPMITFGLKQIPEKKNEDGPGLSWDGFISVVQRLANRELTGNVARSSVEAIMNTATKSQWNGWYRRILIKDLRCGVSEKTINKVVKRGPKKYSIPVFECQLAHDSSNHEGKVAGRKFIEVKLDGVRVITIVYPSGRVDQFSRNGKELVNFEHIKAQLSEVGKGFDMPYVLDGEVMSSSFQDLMKQVHRKSDVDASDAILYLFDIIPLVDFQKGFSNLLQDERSGTLRNWYELEQDNLPNVRVLEQELVDLDTAEGQEHFREINQNAIDGGYEGIMIKDVNAPYECKRSTAWLKLKPFIEVSLQVTAVEEGTGRNAGRLGALVCEGHDLGKTIRVNVGSGFSDSDRDDFWHSRNKVVGQIVEVRADAVTQNQDGSYSLRFPRFLRFRGFETGEKI